LILPKIYRRDDFFGLLYLSFIDHFHWAIGYKDNERGYQYCEETIEAEENSKAVLKTCGVHDIFNAICNNDTDYFAETKN